jgi:hypothetical protein
MLLKLDVVKAFDMLEWPFLISLLETIGFGPNFVRFIKASQRSARSALRINGRMTEYFQNACSVRQGCPLSPLLFILAIDALSRMLTREVESRAIRGVHIPPLNQYALRMMSPS